MATKLEETRRYYTKYNTLTDTHKFLTKEVSILNSIYKQYPQVTLHLRTRALVCVTSCTYARIYVCVYAT